jgi:hypothetical protein
MMDDLGIAENADVRIVDDNRTSRGEAVKPVMKP